MSESTLSLSYANFANAISDEVRFGSDYTALSAGKVAHVDRIVQEGYRTALLPPVLPGETTPHRWSWLTPIRTLTTTEPYDTGTVTVETGTEDTVTLTDGTWPAWAADGQIVIDGVAYEVLTRVGDTVLTLATDAAVCADSTYSLQRRYYTLDDDFAAIEGPITYEPGQTSRVIRIIGEASIRQMRQNMVNSGRPTHASVSWTIPTVGTGQRARIEFYPYANAAYLLTYRCKILTNKLASTGNTIPLGGMEFGETIMAACLACAEKWRTRAIGPRWSEFMMRLVSSVAADRQQGPQHMSVFGAAEMIESGYVGYTPHIVTYNGYPT